MMQIDQLEILLKFSEKFQNFFITIDLGIAKTMFKH